MEAESKPLTTVTYEQDGSDRTAARLTIAGVDVSRDVSRMTFDHNRNDKDHPWPSVFIELKKGVELDPLVVEASVFIRETILEEPADAMLRFIEPLDPAEFEKACLAALEMGGPSTFGEAALYVLRGYAGGGA